MEIKELLFPVSSEKYGENFKGHSLEIYKMYVEMADRISSRRHSANSFFLSINTAIIALISYVNLGNTTVFANHYWIISIAGIILSYIWYRGIKSYKGLNSGKFKVIHEIEKNLPLAPYTAEWKAIGQGKNPALYKPFSHVEMYIPFLFMGIHTIVLLCSI